MNIQVFGKPNVLITTNPEFADSGLTEDDLLIIENQRNNFTGENV